MGSMGGPNRSAHGSYQTHSSESNATVTGRMGDSSRTSSSERARGVRHLSYNEMMERKNKGLCFRCGERYSPTHQCAAKSLRVIILADDELQGGETEDGQEVFTLEAEPEKDMAGLECRLMGLMGISSKMLGNCRTMQVEAEVN